MYSVMCCVYSVICSTNHGGEDQVEEEEEEGRLKEEGLAHL